MKANGNTRPAKVAEESTDLVKKTVLEWLRDDDAVVVLFGSRATGHQHRYSDFDVGVLPGPGFDRARLPILREMLDELNIPYNVELVDLSTTSEAFRRKALKEGIVWKS